MKGLPTVDAPPAEQQAESRALAETIRSEIQDRGGWISFERYMHLALYTPALGYYAGRRQIFGAGGDYVTAPGLGGLFAACVAGQVAEVLTAPELPPAVREEDAPREIVEFGAGGGDLAAMLLLELDRLGALPDRYSILETGAALRARQQERIAALPGPIAGRVRWLREMPDRVRGVILANEVLDAMPFHRFRVQPDGRVSALGVKAAGDGFCWDPGGALPGAADLAGALGLPPGYESEWSRQVPAWVRTAAERLEAGVLLLVDYGYDRRTYYHADRSMGTMRCHYRHLAHDDPFLWPGLQDITAHVDFSGVWEAARAAGLTLIGYADQARFLVGAGFADIYAGRHREAGAGSQEAMALAAEARRLTMPGEMGEQFKCIALGRNLGGLSAFADGDQSHRLAA